MNNAQHTRLGPARLSDRRVRISVSGFAIMPYVGFTANRFGCGMHPSCMNHIRRQARISPNPRHGLHVSFQHHLCLFHFSWRPLHWIARETFRQGLTCVPRSTSVRAELAHQSTLFETRLSDSLHPSCAGRLALSGSPRGLTESQRRPRRRLALTSQCQKLNCSALNHCCT